MARNSQDGAPPRGEDPHQVLDKELQSIIRTAARRAADKGRLRHGEVEDLEQDLTVAVLEARKSFDPDRGDWRSYAKKAIELRRTKVLRGSFAQKRNHRGVVSLSVQVRIDDDEGSTELVHLLTRRDAERRTRTGIRDEHDLAQLLVDVNGLIASLPFRVRELARTFKRETVSQFSQQREFRGPRSTTASRSCADERRTQAWRIIFDDSPTVWPPGG